MYKVVSANYDIAKEFIKCNYLIVKNDKSYKYYCLIQIKNDGIDICSLLSLKIKDGKMKVRSNYTPEGKRGHGYFTILLKSVLEMHDEVNYIYADCTDYSVNIYKKLGFREKYKKHFKSFNITRVILDKRR